MANGTAVRSTEAIATELHHPVKGKAWQRPALITCSEKINYLRIDTHEDNQPMQDAVLRYGFRKCGIIHIRDGSKRVAFDYIKG